MADVETVPERVRLAPKITGLSPHALLLRDELKRGSMQSIASLELGGRRIEIRAGEDSLWAIVRRGRSGGLALRVAHAPGGCHRLHRREPEQGEALRIEFRSRIGRHVAAFRLHEDEVPILRTTAWIEPLAPLLVPYLPRDLYPLGQGDDPALAEGNVEAAQRGLNSGLIYFRQTEPALGTTLYFQNLTTLNPWFRATSTTPDGAVGGEWPELGYLPPPRPNREPRLPIRCRQEKRPRFPTPFSPFTTTAMMTKPRWRRAICRCSELSIAGSRSL